MDWGRQACRDVEYKLRSRGCVIRNPILRGDQAVKSGNALHDGRRDCLVDRRIGGARTGVNCAYEPG